MDVQVFRTASPLPQLGHGIHIPIPEVQEHASDGSGFALHLWITPSANLLYLSMGLRHPCNEYSLEPPQGPGWREEGADVVGACMHGARQWLLLENI
jgi:hypothetical protein